MGDASISGTGWVRLCGSALAMVVVHGKAREFAPVIVVVHGKAREFAPVNGQCVPFVGVFVIRVVDLFAFFGK